jgi:hypothetical protein
LNLPNHQLPITNCQNKIHDFTLKAYKKLITELEEGGYQMQRVQDFALEPAERTVILRHDVDRKPDNALKMAKLEYKLNIPASYYFRCRNGKFSSEIIEQVADFGHEIGYHYECLDSAKGDKKKAFDIFRNNLAQLRTLYPVKTITMHGSPLSNWNNLELWNIFNYKDLGIIAEPYLDFEDIAYITDAGRHWNDTRVNRRDFYREEMLNVNSIFAIPAVLREKNINKVMLNIHPEHWASSNFEWMKIYVNRKLRNLLKKVFLLLVRRER